MRSKHNTGACSLAALTLAGALAITAPAAVLAQGKNTDSQITSDPAAGAAMVDYQIDVPTIELVDSSMDEDAIREILNGNIADHAEELAALTATSITIPELTVTYSLPEIEGEAVTGSFTYHDFVLNNVTDGVAESTSLASAEGDSGPLGSVSMGAMTTGTFNIGGLLAFYGLVEPYTSGELEVIYADLALEGGSFTSPEVSCEFGAVEAAEFSARPLKTSFGDLMAMAQEMGPNSEPTPEQIGEIVSFYADLLTAIETSPISFAGFDCNGTNPDGEPMQATIGPMNIGAFTAGRYPEIDVSDVLISGDDGQITLASALFKGFDLTGPISILEEAGEDLNEQWFTENARRLIPAFEGFSLTGLDIDVPDTSNEDARTQMSLADFDLTLGNWFEGIPTSVSSFATDFVFVIPENNTEEGLKRLQEMGINELDLDYEVEAAWNEDTGTIDIASLSLDGANLGSVAIAAILGNASAELFNMSPDVAMMAAMGLTAKEVSLDIQDGGLASLLFGEMGKQQGADEQTMRSVLGASVQAMLIATLGAGPESETLGSALETFFKGATSLSIKATSISEEGVSAPELMAIQEDPKALNGKFTIEATAE